MCVCFRSEDEEDEDSLTGTKVRVKYGRGKTQKIYEAHIKKTDVDNGEQFYLVHYYGWNVRSVSTHWSCGTGGGVCPRLMQVCLTHRYDEWVKADRIIWPAEKGTKKRPRKKVKVSGHLTSRLSCDLVHEGSQDRRESEVTRGLSVSRIKTRRNRSGTKTTRSHR